MVQDLEQHLRSVTLAPADVKRARELLEQVRMYIERGEMQLAGNAGDEFMRILGHHPVRLACGAPALIVPPPATTAGSPAN
jgi:hypothetical protein